MNKSRAIKPLIEFIDSRSDVPFGWHGDADCVAYAALAVNAQTGSDPRGTLRWTSKRKAMTMIAHEGGLEAAIDRRLKRIPAAHAMRGDIAAVADDQLGIRLMIVEGAMLVGPGDTGNEREPRSAMLFAWDALSAGDERDHV